MFRVYKNIFEKFVILLSLSEEQTHFPKQCNKILEKYPHAKTGRYKNYLSKHDNIGNEIYCYMTKTGENILE